MVQEVQYQKQEVFFESLPSSFDGYTILHLSDLHFRRKDERKRQLLACLGLNLADLCTITGDFIERDDAIDSCSRALRNLRTRDGILGVLGNHDYFEYSLWDMFRYHKITGKPNNTERLVRSLSDIGINVLRNECVEVRKNGESIWVLGTDDEVTHNDDMSEAVKKIPQRAFMILLSHTPDILRKYDFPHEHLVLAGHTHGGQVRLPFWGPIVNHSKLKKGFVSGQIDHGKGVLFVSNGVGVNRLFPFRFRCRPEVHTIILRKRPGSLHT